MQRKGQRDPLVVLDAAVVMGVHEREPVALVQRVLLEVKARAVDVRAQDVHAGSERLRANLHQNERLAVRGRPHLVASHKRTPFARSLVERTVAMRLGQTDGGCRAFALGLVLGDETDVFCSQFLQGLVVGLVVFVPCHVAFHRCPFLTVRGFPPQPSQAPNRGRFPRLPLFLRYYRRPVRQRPESRPIFHRAAKSTNTALADEL